MRRSSCALPTPVPALTALPACIPQQPQYSQHEAQLLHVARHRRQLLGAAQALGAAVLQQGGMPATLQLSNSGCAWVGWYSPAHVQAEMCNP